MRSPAIWVDHMGEKDGVDIAAGNQPFQRVDLIIRGGGSHDEWKSCFTASSARPLRNSLKCGSPPRSGALCITRPIDFALPVQPLRRLVRLVAGLLCGFQHSFARRFADLG